MKALARFALLITGILMIVGVIGGGVYLALFFSDYSGQAFALTLYIVQLAIQLLVGLYGVSSKRKPLVCLLLDLLLIGLGVYSSFLALGTLVIGALATLFIVPIIYLIAALIELFCKKD